MKNILSIAALALSLFIANSASAQVKKAKKQEDPKKKEQKDTTKTSSGSRMAINSSGLPTKGKKTTSNSNSRTVADPKTEPKKDEGKKSDEKK